MSRGRRVARGAGILTLVLASGLGCAWWPWRDQGPPGDPRYGVEVVDFEGITQFHERANTFYQRLSNRRVNTYATYTDRVLREHFQTEEAFADYYADLADALAFAWFERNQALEVRVVEFLFDRPGSALVKLRLSGENGLPLRPGRTHLEREDRWVRRDGTWWVDPAQL